MCNITAAEKGASPEQLPNHPQEAKKDIFAIIKTGDFKTNSKGFVQVDGSKERKESDAAPEDNDAEKFLDFVGVQELNIGELKDVLDNDNSCWFFGINFGKFLILGASPKAKSKSAGGNLADVKSGRGNRLTFYC